MNILPKEFPSLLPLSQGPRAFLLRAKAHRFWYMTHRQPLLCIHTYSERRAKPQEFFDATVGRSRRLSSSANAAPL